MTSGLRFQCQNCGLCCHTRGEAGYVLLLAADQARLALHLGLAAPQFKKEFTHRVGERTYLKDAPGSDRCILLGEGGCRAYAARPLQCRTWPFWPEHLKPGAFAREVASFCPGAGRGDPWDPDVVEIIALVQRQADKE